MSRIAFLTWNWYFAGPLHTGYSQNLAEFTGRRERGSRTSINLETHSDPRTLEPAFLASSVKGVFRAAAVWLLEREARSRGATRYVTCDFNAALDERWQEERRSAYDGLCPACRLFGGAGCLSAVHRQASAGALRLRSPVSFGFGGGDDAVHGSADFGPAYFFTWQRILNKGLQLSVEQFEADDVILAARVDPAEDEALALLWLAGDLISSGAFRFGRFASRGYGHVRLAPAGFFRGTLDAMLETGESIEPYSFNRGSGFQIGRAILQEDPHEIIRRYVAQFLD